MKGERIPRIFHAVSTRSEGVRNFVQPTSEVTGKGRRGWFFFKVTFQEDRGNFIKLIYGIAILEVARLITALQ